MKKQIELQFEEELKNYVYSLKGKVNCIIDSPQALVLISLNNRLKTTTMQIRHGNSYYVLDDDEFEPGLVCFLEICSKCFAQEGLSEEMKKSIQKGLELIGNYQESFLGKSLFYYGLCLEQGYNRH